MNETHEPSYYEIALTNRQVLVAFVVLLLSVLGAFVGGVWLGRGGPERPDLSTVVASETPSDLDAAEELTFFSDKEPRADGPAAPRVPARRPAEPDRREPPRGDRDDQIADAGQAVTAPPKVAPPPPRETPPAQVPPPPAAAPRVAPPPPTRPPADTVSSRPSSKGPGFVIQLFSGRDEAQAKQVLQRLKSDGQQAFLSPVQVGSLTMYRVRVGVFADRAAADKTASAIRRKHKLDTWITAVEN